jgi:hypothetical protein
VSERESYDSVSVRSLLAEWHGLRRERDEARGLYLQQNYRLEQLERELAAMRQQRDELITETKEGGGG